MMNQKIVFTARGVAELLDAPMPTVGDGDVLVKIVRTSISAGTERANLLGDVYSMRTGKPLGFPRQCGYSASGIVEAIGKDVTTVKVGDRVACAWSDLAAYCALPEHRVYRLDDSVGFGAAALIHIATFPIAAVRKVQLEIGESAIVMGQGVLGMMAVGLLRAAGAVPIIAVDPVKEKREQALALGADYALDPFDPDFAKRAKELTGGGANVAIEVTGKGQGLDQVLDCMKPFGRVALLGCTRHSDFTIDYYRKVHGPGISLIGAHTNARPKVESSHGLWTDGDDARAVHRLITGGRFDLEGLIKEVHLPEEAPAVFTRLANESHFPVVQFDWRNRA